MKKSSYMMIRLSHQDKEILREVAKKNEVSLSDYVLTASLNKAKKDKK